MARVRIVLLDDSYGRKVTVVVPSDVSVARLIPAIVKQLGLQDTDINGNDIVYQLAQINENGDINVINPGKTLEDAGVEDGATLHLTVEMIAGGDNHYIPKLPAPVPTYQAQFISAIVDEMLSVLKSRQLIGVYRGSDRVLGKPSDRPQFICDVFMITPFRAEFHSVYQDAILETLNNIVTKRDWGESDEIKVGLIVKRGDQFRSVGGSFMSDIWSAINQCKLVVAECTPPKGEGINANVYYELGMAHAIGKPSIILTQDINSIPSDLRHHRIIPYSLTFGTSNDIRAMQNRLRIETEALLEEWWHEHCSDEESSKIWE
ncbi:MAG: nucleoside 2-deoxyribosyltransferase [Anaerolineaceae bacterium]|nr:nucleoside 2-deoxyribosyltransferase [Anaerolineaceae bacterium]